MTTSKPIDTKEIRRQWLEEPQSQLPQQIKDDIRGLCEALDALRARIVELEKVCQAAVGTVDLKRDIENEDWLEG